VILQPELLLSKVNKDENIFRCLALFVQFGLQMISERDDEYIFVSQHSRKPMLAAVIVFDEVIQKLQTVVVQYKICFV
jgi:hypothetical protein